MLHYLPYALSSFASDIDGVIRLIYWICGAWFVLAQAVLFWFIFSSRHRPGVRAAWLPADTARTNAWVLVPVLAVLACDAVIEAAGTPVWEKIKIDPPEGDVQVKITGRQFAWLFTYPGLDGELDTADDVVLPELHVPLGKVVRFQLESQDVLHSFYVPELRLKQDAIPGRNIPGWFDTSKEGTYEIGCAEICGKSHTMMRSLLVVQSETAWKTWLTEQGAA